MTVTGGLKRPGIRLGLVVVLLVWGTTIRSTWGTPVPAPSASPRAAPTGPPAVQIDAPRDGVSRDRIVTVRGTVSDLGVGLATLVHNGTAYRMRVRDGAFQRNLVMSPGQNFIEVFAENARGTGKAAVSLLSRIPRSDIQVLMWWDADASDMDLWVTDPNGDRCWYRNRQTPAGGSLDVDVTDVFGPETFTNVFPF